MCNCREGLTIRYDGKVEPTGLNAHHCLYISQRNALIPEAERLALAEVGKDEYGKPNSGFSREFIRVMDKLARELEIVV